MNTTYSSQKKIITIAVALLLIGGGLMALWYYTRGGAAVVELFEKPVVVEERLALPNTKEVTPALSRGVNTQAYNTPLVPRSNGERVIVPGATLTLKESYTKSFPLAYLWAPDAKLVLIKSLGAVTLDGTSSQWQIIYGSLLKKKGYEVVMQGDAVVSKKEVISSNSGYDLPRNWYEAKDAIVSLQTLPQFSDATISGINFFYNADSGVWGYGIATSRGSTAMPVR